MAGAPRRGGAENDAGDSRERRVDDSGRAGERGRISARAARRNGTCAVAGVAARRQPHDRRRRRDPRRRYRARHRGIDDRVRLRRLRPRTERPAPARRQGGHVVVHRRRSSHPPARPRRVVLQAAAGADLRGDDRAARTARGRNAASRAPEGRRGLGLDDERRGRLRPGRGGADRGGAGEAGDHVRADRGALREAARRVGAAAGHAGVEAGARGRRRHRSNPRGIYASRRSQPRRLRVDGQPAARGAARHRVAAAGGREVAGGPRVLRLPHPVAGDDGARHRVEERVRRQRQDDQGARRLHADGAAPRWVVRARAGRAVRAVRRHGPRLLRRLAACDVGSDAGEDGGLSPRPAAADRRNPERRSRLRSAQRRRRSADGDEQQPDRFPARVRGDAGRALQGRRGSRARVDRRRTGEQLLALTRFGGPQARPSVQQIVENLILQQQPSGGWKECPTENFFNSANPFSTGQVLYAFKQAGVSISSSPFIKGVKYLLAAQQQDGSWKADTAEMRTMGAAYAPTMWAIIGLAGSFGTVKAGGLQITTELPPEQMAAHRNLEIVLDASGSMKAALGKSTRIATARQVLKDVLAKIPDDFNVGLRVYARRFSSRDKQTCTDTELLRPIQKLDRQQIVSTVDGVVPRGETPLVYSILQTPADLKAAGGGSIIVITDGEETCGGDPVKAAEQLKAAGIPLTLNIVGFTLTGKKVEQQLSQFAEATGGHYYSAQDGAALTKALTRAALARFPYTVFDMKGTQVASGIAGPLAEALPPGDYKVVVQAGDSEITATVTVTANGDAILQIVDRGDRFELVKKN
ncbi:MAG: hypothetical protein DMF85_11425 [Acidobacteria bacterium]|nr:MAG: hypothetical protein DMF85_11425 [Acidobacteriota bacterium]